MAESSTLHLTAVVTRDGDWYVARCLEVEATSQGETIEQALANLSGSTYASRRDEPDARGRVRRLNGSPR
jgi:hypothetical protein